MSTFKDSKHRDWTISLDAPKIREVRKRCEVDLADVKGESFGLIASDPCLLVDVLWVLCEKQAREHNPSINDIDFGEALVGDAIERATDAMLGAIADFFPNRRGKILRAAHGHLQTAQANALTRVEATIADPKLEAKLTAMMNAEVDRAMLPLTQLTSVSNTPDSAESAPTGARSAN